MMRSFICFPYESTITPFTYNMANNREFGRDVIPFGCCNRTLKTYKAVCQNECMRKIKLRSYRINNRWQSRT